MSVSQNYADLRKIENHEKDDGQHDYTNYKQCFPSPLPLSLLTLHRL